jgi:hypothetical protein
MQICLTHKHMLKTIMHYYHGSKLFSPDYPSYLQATLTTRKKYFSSNGKLLAFKVPMFYPSLYFCRLSLLSSKDFGHWSASFLSQSRSMVLWSITLPCGNMWELSCNSWNRDIYDLPNARHLNAFSQDRTNAESPTISISISSLNLLQPVLHKTAKVVF